MALSTRVSGALLALGAAASLIALAGIRVVAPAAGQPVGVTVELDMDVSGNGPRAVGPIEDCVSASVGQAIHVDVVVPAPGIAADTGISGFGFSFFYDGQLLSVTGHNVELLLAQAPGSSVIPFSEPLPSDTGDHTLSVIDFGGSGIEPNGSSEAGPGVLARITLLAKATGISAIAVRKISLATDSLKIVQVPSAPSTSIAVGVPCPSPTPSPPAAAPAAGSTPSPSPTLRTATGATPSQATGFAASGGPPGGGGRMAMLLIVIGTGTALGGALIIITATRDAKQRGR